jgi:hypothetical protein
VEWDVSHVDIFAQAESNVNSQLLICRRSNGFEGFWSRPLRRVGGVSLGRQQVESAAARAISTRQALVKQRVNPHRCVFSPATKDASRFAMNTRGN